MTRRIVKLSLPLSVLAAVGCSSTGTQQVANESDIRSQQIAQQQAELEARQAQIRAMEAELARKEAALNNRPAPAARTNTAASGSGLFPPAARPGECFARVLAPAKYRPVTKRVVKREASERIEIIPAQYTWGEQRVKTKDGYTQLVIDQGGKILPVTGDPRNGGSYRIGNTVVNPTFSTVTERVMVKPPRKKVQEVQAKFKTVTERVIDQPAHTKWKKGNGPSGAATRVDENTGEIMCLVNVPATYKTITKRVLAQKAGTRVVQIPAEYTTITRTVVKNPPRVREIKVPAAYKTIRVQKLVKAAQERRIPVPAQYETVTTTEKVTDARVSWGRVYCEVNMTKDLAVKIQQSLTRSGYYNGPIDGIVGSQTMSALNRFEKAKGLPTGSNYIPFETARALGVL